MAKYSTIAKYIQGMKDSGAPVPGGEQASGRTIDVDSNCRNYIARQYQRLVDSGVDLGEGSRFYENAYGKTMSGFSDGLFYMGDANTVGAAEMEAMAYAVQQLDQMQSDGQITMEQYQDMMVRMISPDSIDSLEAGGNGKDGMFMGLLDKIDDLSKAEFTPEEKAANQAANRAALADTREVINDKDDYLRSARASDPSRAGGLPEGFNSYDGMLSSLDEAKAAGLLDDDAYDAAAKALRNYDNNTSVTDKDREIMHYAMQDVLAAGDPELAGKVMSPTGFMFVGQSIYGNETGTSILREIEDARAQAGRPGPESGEPHVPGADTEQPDVNAGVRVDVDDEKMEALTTRMITNFFGDEENGITIDEYAELKAQYDQLGENAQEGFRKDNPEFAKAEWYMGKIDALQAGVESGRFDITESTDSEGNKTYGIRYNDPADQELKQRDDKLREALEKAKQKDDPEFLITADISETFDVWRNPEIFDLENSEKALKITTDIYGPPYDETPMLIPDGIVDGMNGAMQDLDGFENDSPEATDPEHGDPEATDLEADDPEITAPEHEDPDFDAVITLDDLEILDKKSPMEEFEARRNLAIQIWRGDLGNGADRVSALADMGYDETARQEIQSMVNQGMEWCRNVTPEDYDKLFPSADGTLAERDEAFRAQQLDAAARIMTYEGDGDLSDAYSRIMADAAAQGRQVPDLPEGGTAAYYDKAARILDGAHAADAAGGLDGQVSGESYGNLAGYVADNPDAGFQGLVSEDGSLAYASEPDAKNGPEETAGAESSYDEGYDGP